MSSKAEPGLHRYLAECYWPRMSDTSFQEAVRRARSAADRLSAEGEEVHYLGALLVPTDELAFCLFAARTQAAVERAGREARIEFDRVVEAIQVPEARS